ncbi:MAG TPA: PPOX class F420-dependent oxidoreductase [Nitrososphaeraceae archaeon]
MSRKANNSNSLADPAIRRLFEGKNFVSFASLMKDGGPHVAPTWVDIENGTILVNTAIGRIKHKNIERDERVALSIFDQNNPYEMVTVRGRVVQKITGSVADNHIDKLAKKYLGKDKYPYRAPGEERILLKVEPMKVFHIKI